MLVLLSNFFFIFYNILGIIFIFILSPSDTVGDLKKLIGAKTGNKPSKIRLQKWYTVYKDHITLEDYEIHD